MEALGLIGAFIAGLIVLYLLGMLFVVPIKIIWKLIINGVIGFALLFVCNLVGGALFSFTLALNPLTALIAGFLGVPGVVLLIVLTLFL